MADSFPVSLRLLPKCFAIGLVPQAGALHLLATRLANLSMKYVMLPGILPRPISGLLGLVGLPVKAWPLQAERAKASTKASALAFVLPSRRQAPDHVRLEKFWKPCVQFKGYGACEQFGQRLAAGVVCL